MNMIPLAALERPIAYHRIFRRISGSTVAGVFLSQAWYWTQRLPDERNGWFYKTQIEWEEETGLSRSEQETARKHLAKIGVLEEKREGLPALLWYRIDADALTARINDEIKTSMPTQSCMGDMDNLDAVIPATIHTENTTETTSSPRSSRAKKQEALPEHGVSQQIVKAFCDAVGIEKPTAYGKAVGQAKLLANAGVVPADIPVIVTWLRDQSWITHGFDLGTVVAQLDKWRSSKPRPVVTVVTEDMTEREKIQAEIDNLTRARGGFLGTDGLRKVNELKRQLKEMA